MRVETHRTILVPADNVSAYRQLAAHFPGGSGMFVTPLYTGAALTHYISSGFIDKAVADMLDDPAAMAQATGATVEQTTALREQMHISTRTDVHAELAELGLTLEAVV
jgi:hypothetical protein